MLITIKRIQYLLFFLKPLLCQESVLKSGQISNERKYPIFQIDDNIIKIVFQILKKYLEKHKDTFYFTLEIIL